MQQVEEGITDGGGQGIISLMVPPFIGVAGASPANGGSGVAARAGTVFLEEGILASTIVIQEVAHYLVRHESSDEFWEDMNYISRLRSLELLDFDQNMMQNALKLLSKYWKYGIGGRDAVLLATMVTQDVNKIMTHDGAFKNLRSKFDEIENFTVIDTVPKKNELINTAETRK